MKIVIDSEKERIVKHDTSLFAIEKIEVYAIVTFLKKKHYVVSMNHGICYIDENEVSLIDSVVPSDWIYRDFRKPYKIEKAYDMYGSDVMKIEQYIGPKEFIEDQYFLFNILFYPKEAMNFFHNFQKNWYKNQEINNSRYMKVFIDNPLSFKKKNHMKNLQIIDKELEVYAIVEFNKHKYYLLQTEEGLKYIHQDSVMVVSEVIPEDWTYRYFDSPHVIQSSYHHFLSKHIKLKQYLGPKEFLENEQFLLDVLFCQNEASSYFCKFLKNYKSTNIKARTMNYYQKLIQYLDWHYERDIQEEYIVEVSKIKNLNLLIQPDNENVWENCAIILAKKSDYELTPYLLKLFDWTQNLNWPGAYIILERLQKFDPKIIKDVFESVVCRVLENEDELWLNNLSLLFKNASFKFMLDKEYTKYLDK